LGKVAYVRSTSNRDIWIESECGAEDRDLPGEALDLPFADTDVEFRVEPLD